MEERYTLTAVIMDENITYTCVEACQKLQITEIVFHELEEQGLFQSQSSLTEPVITQGDLKRIERAYRIHQDLNVNIPGVVLVLELLEEMQELQQRLAILER